jgi:hypothetical protein
MMGAFRQLGISLALGSCLALGCGGEKSETPAPTPTPPAATGANPAAAPGPAPMPPPEKMFQDVWVTELPANFPEDVPQYPGAEVVKARPSTDAGISVAWSTGDDQVKVASYYADQLAAKGWATNRVDAPEGIVIFADKGKRSATLGVTPAEGKTTIDLLVVEMP